MKIEENYSKDEILAMYLSVIYFGAGAYGINEASRIYFGCEPCDLTVAQAATLAGILKNPSRYSPKNSLESATERRNLVLDVMCREGYITEAERDEAKAEKMRLAKEGEKGENYAEQYVAAAVREACGMARHHGIPAGQLRTGHHDRFRPGKAEDPRRRNARPLQLLRRRRKRLCGAPRQRDGRDSGILRHTRLRDIAPGGLRPQTARRIRSRARRGRDHARHTGARRKDGLRRILTRQFRRRLLRRHHAARSHQTLYEHGGGESALVCRHGYRARLSAETGSESFRKGFQPRSRAGGDGGRDQSAHSRRSLLGAGARRKLRQAALRKGDSKRRSQDRLPGRARGKSLFARKPRRSSRTASKIRRSPARRARFHRSVLRSQARPARYSATENTTPTHGA